MGFIVFAIPIVALEEKRVLKGRARNLAFAVLGAAFVVAVTLLNPTAGSGMVPLPFLPRLSAQSWPNHWPKEAHEGIYVKKINWL